MKSLISIWQNKTKSSECDSTQFVLSRSFVVEHRNICSYVIIHYLFDTIIAILKNDFNRTFQFSLNMLLLVKNLCTFNIPLKALSLG